MSPGPTHQFCPNCNALLPPHLEECPRCGTNLKTGEAAAAAFSGKDILQMTGVIVLVAAVPLCIIIVTGFLCVNSLQ